MTLVATDDLIETERLILRRIESRDLGFYTRVHADPDVARYIAHGNPRTPEETSAWLEAMLQSYESLGLGQLAVTLKADGSLLGRCGVSHLEIDPADDFEGVKTGYFFPTRAPEGVTPIVEAELGYTFDRAAWGHGYASEAVAGVYAYVRSKRPTSVVASLIMAENARSMKVAARFGVRYVDRVGLWGRVFNRYRY
jgi:ribosomal-protein-alanine N-acetyltransferase